MFALDKSYRHFYNFIPYFVVIVCYTTTSQQEALASQTPE
jgi:hypothetical protein